MNTFTLKNFQQRFDYRIFPFILIFSYFLSFIFEGKSFYILSTHFNINPSGYVFISIIANLLGLLFCGFFINNAENFRIALLTCTVISILFSFTFYFPILPLWKIAIAIISFSCGIIIALFGYYLKYNVTKENRKYVCADILVYSNIMMIIINSISVFISPLAGNTISIILLLMSIFIIFVNRSYLDETLDLEPEEDLIPYYRIRNQNILVFLFIFITFLTITSGLMYQFVLPSFSHISNVASSFWAVPYILVIVLIKKASTKLYNSFYIYAGIGMAVAGFFSFMLLDHSILSFYIINTLMLSSYGILDFFCWKVSAEMTASTRYPARIFAIALSASLIGISIGNYLSKYIHLSHSPTPIAVATALAATSIALIVLPSLLKQLEVSEDDIRKLEAASLDDVIFSGNVRETLVYEQFSPDSSQSSTSPKANLTQREDEVLKLLIQGMTNKAISSQLFISENTVKTHIKNIYSKYNVTSRAQLIKQYMENSMD